MALPKSLINQKDVDSAVDYFEKVVKNVVENGDEVQQTKLFKKLQDLTKFMLVSKEPDSVETMEVPLSMKIPNEIWLQIMNYLPTTDVFGVFALLNKRLNGLTIDSRALKYLTYNHQLDSSNRYSKKYPNKLGRIAPGFMIWGLTRDMIELLVYKSSFPYCGKIG